jgi:hypothetical protein
MFFGSSTKIRVALSSSIPTSFPPLIAYFIGKVFPLSDVRIYRFPKPVLKLVMPPLVAGMDVFEIIILLAVVTIGVVVVAEPEGVAIAVLFLSFTVAGLAVVFTGNPLELMEDEFRTFAALVNVERRIIKTNDTATIAINRT